MKILNEELQSVYCWPQNNIPPMISQPIWMSELKMIMHTENTSKQSLVSPVHNLSNAAIKMLKM